MKTAHKVIWLCSSLLSFVGLLALVVGTGPAFADEAFSKTSIITVPGGLKSFDIGFVDPKLGLYFLADRTNKTIDQVKTSDNSITQLAKGKLVGPNGVITANDHTQVWAGDSVDPVTKTSSVKVIDLANPNDVFKTIDTKGVGRSDELCEDPQHHVVLVANDDDADLFLTFISTETYKIIGNLTLKGTDPNAQNIKATHGIEQCQWSPRTRKFYLAVPEVNGDGTNSVPGVVLEINPASMKVEKVFDIDFGFLAATGSTKATADCLGPQGLAIGPQREILLGCSNSGAGTVIINELDGSLVQNLPGLNGNDEVWYNPGDNHYFLAGGNHKIDGNPSTPILGVADQSGDPDVEDASPTTLTGSHSVAADPVKNQVYVPINGGNDVGSAVCGTDKGGTALVGCIAVFTTTSDDPGICSASNGHGHGKSSVKSKDGNGKGEQGDPLFRRFVCPSSDNQGNDNQGNDNQGNNNQGS